MKKEKEAKVIQELVAACGHVLLMNPEGLGGAFEQQLIRAVRAGKRLLKNNYMPSFLLGVKVTNKEYFDMLDGKIDSKILKSNHYQKSRFFRNEILIKHEFIKIFCIKNGESLQSIFTFNGLIIVKRDSKVAKKGDYLVKIGTFVE